GVVNIVSGFGPEAGAPMLTHPDVQAISFTGSSDVGRMIGETAAKSFKHCSLEMGGKNAIIVLDDANIDLAVDGAVWGGFGTTGQRCTAASRVIVQKNVYNQLTEQLDDRISVPKVGNGLDERTNIEPHHNEQHRK